MRIHYLQHVNFEGPAAIEEWAREAGHSMCGSLLHRGEALPDSTDLDLLILLGGPMSVNDEQDYNWLQTALAIVLVEKGLHVSENAPLEHVRNTSVPSWEIRPAACRI